MHKLISRRIHAPRIALFKAISLACNARRTPPEIRGKTKTGKVIEVEVKDDGTFVDIEK